MINTEALKKYIEGNYKTTAEAANEMNIDPAVISRLLTGKRDAGAKTLLAITKFCKIKNLNLEDYIFLS